MDDSRNWIFAKLPNWLRWIIALPVSVIGGCIAFLILSLINRFGGMGYTPGTFLFGLSQSIMLVVCFIFLLYLCVPRWKFIITGVFAIFLSILFIVSTTIVKSWGEPWNNDDTITIIVSIGLIIYAIVGFIYSREDEKQNS